MRSLVVPAAAIAAQQQGAPGQGQPDVQGLEARGFSLLTLGAVIAAAIALIQLRRGGARLGPPGTVALAVAVLLVATHALQPALLFESWDPLWPRWLAHARDLAYGLMDDATVLIPLLCFLIAADALDRLPRAHGLPAPERGRSLWMLARGRIAESSVALASARGFLVGAVCGGVLAAGTLVAVALGARVQLQPRGFFFYALNSSSPALITVCFFAQIAVLEELGYRFFAGTWLERLSGNRALAIALPAAVYGLCHTAFEFLPPADPFWVRPLLLAAVGAVWGWAFFRFDALTVVLSHLTCDLFIFNYPQLCEGGAAAGAAVAAISVPLWPAIIGALARLARRPHPHTPEV